jgi:hypothetical protein
LLSPPLGTISLLNTLSSLTLLSLSLPSILDFSRSLVTASCRLLCKPALFVALTPCHTRYITHIHTHTHTHSTHPYIRGQLSCNTSLLIRTLPLRTHPLLLDCSLARTFVQLVILTPPHSPLIHTLELFLPSPSPTRSFLSSTLQPFWVRPPPLSCYSTNRRNGCD